MSVRCSIGLNKCYFSQPASVTPCQAQAVQSVQMSSEQQQNSKQNHIENFGTCQNSAEIDFENGRNLTVDAEREGSVCSGSSGSMQRLNLAGSDSDTSLHMDGNDQQTNSVALTNEEQQFITLDSDGEGDLSVASQRPNRVSHHQSDSNLPSLGTPRKILSVKSKEVGSTGNFETN